MPLDFQLIEVPYLALDAVSDPTELPVGTLTRAENASSQIDGRYGKRFGYETLTDPSSTTAVRLGKRGEELSLFDGLNMKTYLPDISGWRTVGAVPEPSCTEESIVLDQANDIVVGCRSTANGVAVHSWIDVNGFINCRVTQASNGSRILDFADASAAFEIIHSVVCGSRVAVVYSSVTNQLIRYFYIDTTTGSGAGPFNIYTGADVYAGSVPYPYAPFDICPISSTELLMVRCTNTPDIRISKLTVSSGGLVAGAIMSTEVPDGGMAITATAGEIGAILFHSSTATAMRVRGFNPSTLLATYALTTVEADPATAINWNCGLVRVSATSILAIWDRRDVAPVKGYTSWRTVSSAGALGTAETLNNFYVHTKPFTYNGRWYATVYAPYETQESYITIEINRSSPRWQPVASHAYRHAFTIGASMACLTDIDTISAGVFAFDTAIGYKFLSNSSLRAALSSFGMDFTDTRRFLNTEMGNSMFVASAVPFQYDGNVWYENNFLIYPEITSATAGAVGGGGMNNGLYSYLVVFERSDANGDVSRSTTSLPVSATTSAGAGLGKVTLTVDYYLMSAFLSGASTTIASVFRTEASGSTYYFIGSQKMNLLAGSFTFVDSTNDSQILSRRIVYTQGGVLDREPAPPCRQLIQHNNRLWGFSTTDPKLIFYSGEYLPGESPWFSALQQFRIDSGGDIVALASLDERLLVFKSDRIFIVSGRGISATGTNNDLTPPALITSDCGCIEPRSVVVIPQGVMFQSSKGIYMLSRGQEISYIGMPVDSFLDDFPVVTAAVLMPTTREVRFDLASTDGTEGIKLVYNYRDNRWTTHTNYDPGAADNSNWRVDALVIGTDYIVVDDEANVYRETPGAFRDPGNQYISMRLATGWIKLAGKQGLARTQRILVLNEILEEHDLEVQLNKDYVGVSVQTVSLSAADISVLPEEQIGIHVQNQQGESWLVELLDTESDSLQSEGFYAKGLTFLAGVKRGSFEKAMQAGAKA